ncbi:MAG: hypothetical protein IJO88_03735 [Oscillospiraceae bacterium]|nr:hypothetical protein [Oscillospiraceae bacterium]
MRCCVCGQELGSEPAVLLYGTEPKYICDSCERRFEKLFDVTCSKQEKLEICDFLYKRAKMSPDAEVRDHLQEVLRNGGYISDEEKKAQEEERKREEERKASEGGWISILRTLAWIEIIGGCIVSLILGVVFGQGSPALGVLVTLIGILLFIVMNAAFMVFLNLASDVRAIRRRLEK